MYVYYPYGCLMYLMASSHFRLGIYMNYNVPISRMIIILFEDRTVLVCFGGSPLKQQQQQQQQQQPQLKTPCIQLEECLWPASEAIWSIWLIPRLDFHGDMMGFHHAPLAVKTPYKWWQFQYTNTLKEIELKTLQPKIFRIIFGKQQLDFWPRIKKQLCVTEPPVSFGLWDLHSNLHPWRFTCNIVMEVWKIIFLSKWVICRFQPLSFQGVIQVDQLPPLNCQEAKEKVLEKARQWGFWPVNWFSGKPWALSKRNLPWEPTFPSFLGVMTHIFWGPKTPLKVLVHIHYARQNCDIGCILKGLRSFTKQEKATSSFFQSWPFDNPNGGHLTRKNVTQNTQKRSLGRTWIRYFTGWWFWILFIFTPAWGNDENLTNLHIFSLGFGEKPPTRQIGGNFEGFSST